MGRMNRFLRTKDILVLQGARQTGKTTLLKMLMAALKDKKEVPEQNIVYFDLEDMSLLELCDQGAAGTVAYLEGLGYRKDKRLYFFIDEIQYLTNPSNFLKILHDHYPGIKVIVSGSSSFDIRKKFKDSLVGRTVHFELFPLDFDEFLDFKGCPYNLLDKRSLRLEIVQKKLRALFEEYLLYGAYPRIVLEKSVADKEVYLKQILDTYVRKDVRDFIHIRNVQRFNHLLRVLADSAGRQLNVSELSNTLGTARQTIEDYLFILEQTYIIRRVYPFFSNARAEVTKMPKLFFEDTGLRNLLRYGTFIHKVDGHLFENGVYTLLNKNISHDGIRYWRTKQKQEIDFVVQWKGRQLPLEAKLAYSERSQGALRGFKERYDIPEAFIVTLEKPKPSKTLSGLTFLYPWEIYSRVIKKIVSGR